MQEKSKYNNLFIGFIGGLVFPIIVMFIIILMRAKGTGFEKYYQLLNSFGLIADMLRMSLISDLLIFYYFLNKKYYKSVQGVIISAVILGIYIVYVKFLK